MTESPSLTRRDRLRAATMGEITATARRLLVEQGPEAASLRAIAREMGMTAPGLSPQRYRLTDPQPGEMLRSRCDCERLRDQVSPSRESSEPAVLRSWPSL